MKAIHAPRDVPAQKADVVRRESRGVRRLRTKADNPLVMAAALTELILDRAHSAVVAMDERGIVSYWNPSAEKEFGVPRAEAIGRSVADLIVPERLRSAHLAGLERFLAVGEGPILDRRIEMAALRADGSEFSVEMTISALKDSSRWIFYAFVQDISERKASQQENERLVVELRAALHGSERRFDAIVGSLSDPVTIRDREHRFLYANPAALAHLGFDSWEELRETPPAAIMADYLVWGEDGRPVAMEDIPSVRILRGEAADPLLIRTVNRATGTERWNLLKAAPLLDAEDEVQATIMIIEDVTEQQRAARLARFLAQASEVLASSLDYEETLKNVAELAVPGLVDWCAVDLFDEDGDRKPVALAHVDSERLKLAQQLRAYEPEKIDPEQGLGLVFRTREAVLYSDIADELLVQAAVDERHLELLRAVGIRAALIVPMTVGKKVLGAMTLVSADSGRSLGQFDLALAEQLAARAAVAIENSRLYSERSVIAHTLQQSLLPDQLPAVPGYELASVYLPAIESSEVGGDFYDVWEVDDNWMMVIGDVTGKGVGAAVLTALVRHTMRAASEFKSSPADLLACVDRALKQQPSLSLCTALCLRLRGDQVTLSVGGHPLPLYLSASGIESVGEHGPLLGGFDGVGWHDLSFTLAPDSTFITYTDGVTDAVGKDGVRFGLTRLREAVTACKGRSAHGVVARLIRTLREFQIGGPADDMAALVLHRRRSRAQTSQREQAVMSQANEITTLP
jgi:PAS domain S-box-containing protein